MFDSLRVYGTVYVLTLLMKGRIPTKDDIKKTLYGIIQSTAFLSGMGFGYSLFLCSLRKLLGNFNILTVSAIPAFLSSVFSILIERPSRRTLLSLYVSNVATETLWNMAKSRNWVHNIKYGDVAIYSVSMALLLMYYKGGHHKNSNSSSDSMFRVLRFIIGPYEEKDYSVRSSQSSSISRPQLQNNANDGSRSRSGSWQTAKQKNTVFHIVNQMLRIYKKIIYKIKCCDRHNACPHPFSCLYYSLQGAGKMFTVGLGIQVSLKLVLNIRRILQSPSNLKTILLRRESLNLASFLGAYSGLLRLCLSMRNAKKTLNDLASRNKVILTWVPGHSGVRGNEEADRLAREGSAMYPIGPEPILGVPYSMESRHERTPNQGVQKCVARDPQNPATKTHIEGPPPQLTVSPRYEPKRH
ncbi:hypothetical protein NQ317_014459 [Molorchus minor]|uniref:Transmembrane protein 135 N-terminal domain-containing protein n=1 Tax=Molorchus minor TaxID=1323400 RepID=A0ABQ9IT91_9CUCU|nr:hypothetical protein NQ317_014459 [Molorchus minor]